jgi:very-short-patch-repair endonuclease
MAWEDLARAQSGAISRQQLREFGLDDLVITRLVTSGALVRHADGVFLARGAPITYAAELWMAVLSTGGLLGFATAAYLWGMDERPPLVHVIVGTDRRVLRHAHIRRHHVFVPSSAVTTIDGLPATTRSWTLLDHVGRLPTAAALRLVDRGLQRAWLTRPDIARRVSEYPGRQGNVVLRRMLDATEDGAAALSERKLHGLLRRAGIRGWTANHEVRIGGAVAAIVDVAIPAARLAIEVDGFAYHSDVDRFQRDRQRQNTLVALGWTVLRFTWHDLVERPSYVLATISLHLSRS